MVRLSDAWASVKGVGRRRGPRAATVLYLAFSLKPFLERSLISVQPEHWPAARGTSEQLGTAMAAPCDGQQASQTG